MKYVSFIRRAGMKKQTEINKEKKLIERAIHRWENEGGEVLEIAKLKTMTAIEDRQNDGSDNLSSPSPAACLPEKD